MVLRLILPGTPFNNKLPSTFPMLFNKLSGGFGSASNRRMDFTSANDIIIVILSMRVSFLFDHCLQTP